MQNVLTTIALQPLICVNEVSLIYAGNHRRICGRLRILRNARCTEYEWQHMLTLNELVQSGNITFGDRLTATDGYVRGQSLYTVHKRDC
jgi:hypothetical protein